MQYKCSACEDTGNLSKHLAGNLDCTSCSAATDRVELEKWLNKNMAIGDQDSAWLIHQRALAMAPKQEAPHGMAFIGMVGSEQFKYVPEQLATGQPNPKERRRLVREVRDAIKLCAASQIKESAEAFSARDWIKVEDRLPEPYEEVRILFDGVTRIARLNHARAYFQLASFIDCKGQYIATFENVGGWMPLALAPRKKAPVAAPAAANGAMPDLPEIKMDHLNVLAQHYTADQMRAYGKACAAAGPDAALVKALEQIASIEDKMVGGDWEEIDEARTIARAALSGAKEN